MLLFQFICFGREINKAFCGFFASSKYQQYKRLFPENGYSRAQLDQNIEDPIGRSRSNLLVRVSLTSFLVVGFCY